MVVQYRNSTIAGQICDSMNVLYNKHGLHDTTFSKDRTAPSLQEAYFYGRIGHGQRKQALS